MLTVLVLVASLQSAPIGSRVARLEEWKSQQMIMAQRTHDELKAINKKLDQLLLIQPTLTAHGERIAKVESKTDNLSNFRWFLAGGLGALQVLMGWGMSVWLRRKNGKSNGR